MLRTAPGVGPILAAASVLTLDRPEAITHNRQAGAFLGLRLRQSQSGDSNPQHGISKTGNTYLRSLLVQSAHYILGRFGPDCELRRWGLKLAATGAGQEAGAGGGGPQAGRAAARDVAPRPEVGTVPPRWQTPRWPNPPEVPSQWRLGKQVLIVVEVVV